MTYGQEKLKDVIESVLPCKRRAAKIHKKEFQRIKQAERQKVRNELVKFRDRTADVCEDIYDADPFDYNYNHDEEIISQMWQRRDSDNLGALYQWAPKQVQDIRQEDRISYMYSILPDNTIGRHAVSHLEYLDDFYVEHDSDRYYWRKDLERSADAREWSLAAEYAVVEDKLLEIIDTGRVKYFNRALEDIPYDKEITEEEYNQIREEDLEATGPRFAIERRPSGYASWWWRGVSMRERVYKNHHNRKFYLRTTRRRVLKGRYDIPNFVKEVGNHPTFEIALKKGLKM